MRGPRRWTSRSVTLAVAIGLAPLVGIAVSRVLYPYDLGHYEAGTWEPARLLVSGSNPYDLARTLEPPYVMAPYGPAYYAIIGLGLRVFGPQFWFGRVAALIAIVLAGVCVAILARRFGGPGAERLAVLAFATQLPVQAWLAVHRPDALALALALAALTIATARGSASAGAIVAAALVAALAILVRQTVLVPALAIPAWLILETRRRSALAFVLLLAPFVAVPMALLQYTSAGGYLWQQFTLPSTVAFSREQITQLAALFARHVGTWVVAALAAFWLVGRGDARGESDGAEAARRHFGIVLAGSLVLATVLALVTSARRGSNVNYWLEPAALLAVGVALTWRSPRMRKWHALAVWALALGSAAGALTFARAESARWTARPYLDALVATLRNVEPRDAAVLSVYPELAVYAGRPYVFNDGIQYDGRSEPHRALLMRTLREKRLPALVLPFARGPQGYTRVAFDAPGDDVAAVYLFVRGDP